MFVGQFPLFGRLLIPIRWDLEAQPRQVEISGAKSGTLKESTMVLQEQGDQVLETDKGVAADGSPISVRDTFTATGGEFKFLEGRPSAGTSLMAAKRKTNSRSADSTVLRDGKVIRTYHDVLSEDGKTIMETIKGTDDQGKPYETVRLFEKQ